MMAGPLFALGGLSVTAYGAAMALSAAVCGIFCVPSFKKAGLSGDDGEWFLLLALPLGVLLARAAYVLIRLPLFLDRPDGLAFRMWQGGYAVWGAMAGFFLAGWIVSRRRGLPLHKTLDAAAPAGLLMLALGRFCEGLSGQGFGHETPEALAFFPLAVRNEWGENRWAVFLLEGAAALLFLFFVLRQKSGRAALALLLVCASQIFLESLREDEFLSWGFVRAGQVVPAAILLSLLARGLWRRRGSLRMLPRHAVASFSLLTLLVAGVEYALDKTTVSPLLLYALMLLAVSGLFLLVKKAVLPELRQ